MFYDCIVIGGGAAGMTAAITAAGRGINVMLLEHMNMTGKKILSTGNGRCNLTNINMSSKHFYCDDMSFVDKVLDSFSCGETKDFFRGLGIFTKQINGYVYPASAQAASVRTALENNLYYAGADYKCNVNVKKIIRNEEKEQYIVECDNENYTCNQLILATGLKAAPATGSDGSGIKFCSQLGLAVNKVLPSLCHLKSSSPVCKIIGSVRNTCNVKLLVDDKLLGEDTGEVQFTEYGLSGIPVFQISHTAVKSLDSKKKVEIIADTAEFISKEELIAFIDNSAKNYPGMNIVTLLSGLVNNRLAMGISFLSGLSKDGIALRKLTASQINDIAYNVKAMRFPINGFADFDSAQVCQGGVKLSEINPLTMECKNLKNLYVVGELLDVDGICGGYNLQWAFSTGHIAGSSVKNLIKH